MLSLLENLDTQRRDVITWDQYIDNIVARCKQRQPRDAREGPKTRYRDPFGHSVWVCSKRICPVEDVGPLKALFDVWHST